MRATLIAQRRLGPLKRKFRPSCRFRSGVVGVDGLHTPEDFALLANRAIHDANELRQRVRGGKSGSSLGLLRDLDAISNTVCRVIDAAEFCRNAHEDEGWRQASDGAFQVLAEYIQEINTDVGLYDSLRKLTADTQAMGDLNEEQKRMGILLQQEFERDGIHLPEARQHEIGRMQRELVSLESAFSSNIVAKRESFQVPSDLLRSIPASLLRQISSQTHSDGSCTLVTDPHVTQVILKYARNGALREEVYRRSSAAMKDNVAILERLTVLRASLAKEMGFKSYGHRFLADKMVRSPDEVQAFLSDLAAAVKDKAQAELALLQDAKLRCEGSRDIRGWDVPFYMGMVKATKSSLDGRSLSGYFPLERCLEGLTLLLKSLFGITLHEEPVTQEEAWASPRSGVRKILLQHPQEGLLGTIYLDLLPRRGKFSHAAHFTVRCGCAVSYAPIGFQRPVVVLLCNFMPPAAGGACLLSHAELETLFHEFGHALHSLLSRTEFQHLSGTRAPVDFVEIPSQLVENFAWDYRFVKQFARHHETGEVLPREVMDKLKASKNMFVGLDTQTQILYSTLDQRLFGASPEAASSVDSTALLREVQAATTCIPYEPGTYPQARFGHFVGYGSGYYSYLYDRMISSSIWQQGFEADPMSREAGERLWKEVLQHGWAREPHDMIKSMLQGGSCSISSLLKEMSC